MIQLSKVIRSLLFLSFTIVRLKTNSILRMNLSDRINENIQLFSHFSESLLVRIRSKLILSIDDLDRRNILWLTDFFHPDETLVHHLDSQVHQSFFFQYSCVSLLSYRILKKVT